MTVDENRAVALNVACNLRTENETIETTLARAAQIEAFLTGNRDAAPAPAEKPARKKAAAPTQPAVATAAATPTAPAVAPATPPAASPEAPAKPDPAVLVKATEAVIKLANEYSREDAVAILDRRKVARCSQLPADQWQAVLDEAEEAIAKRQAAAASQSLV